MIEVEKPTTCARHPNVETNLRCASCDTPICPNCLVVTPVGMKCKQCASGANSGLYRPSLLQILLVGLTGAAGGAVAGWAVEFSIGFLTLFLAIIYGGFVGETILRVCGRKRGLGVEIPAVAGIVLGALGGRLLVAAQLLSTHIATRPPHGVWSVLLNLVYPIPRISFIALVIVVAAAVSRIRSRW